MSTKTESVASNPYEVPAYMRLWGLGPLILNSGAISILISLWPQITVDWVVTKIVLNFAFCSFLVGIVAAAVSLAAQFVVLALQSRSHPHTSRDEIPEVDKKTGTWEDWSERAAIIAGIAALGVFVLGVLLGMLAWLFVKFDKPEAPPNRPTNTASVTANVRLDLRSAPAQAVTPPVSGPACPPPLTQTDVTRITQLIERTIERTVERQCPSS